MLGDIGDFLSATVKEIGHHPLQALGASLGVPGYDPFFGGLFNNHKGGALLSPTGNFTSSAWNEMYKDNPNSTGGLDLFHRVNSVADVVAPAIAGAYGMGAMGGGASHAGDGAGASGELGSVGGGAVDWGSSLGNAPTGLFSGLNPGASMGSSYGDSALGGGFSGQMAGMSPVSFAGGGAGMNLAPFQQLLSQQSKQMQSNSQGQGTQSRFSTQTMEPYGFAPFSPIRTYPTVTPQQVMAQRLMNYGG